MIRIERSGIRIKLPDIWEYGFVFIKEIADGYISFIEDYVAEGDLVRVKYLGQNHEKRQFSIKQADR